MVVDASAPRAQLQYDCDRSLLGERLAARFMRLGPDAELARFFERVAARPHGRFTTGVLALLSPFATSYALHGLIGAYEMHLLSAEAWAALLGAGPFGSLLDVGAGAGYVTEGARALFREIACTERAAPLRRRLRARGFTALSTDLTDSALGRSFDVVSCLNVLDRTARPRTLLHALKAHLAPGGRLLVSLPLPLAPHVHVRGATIAPSERLPMAARQWEAAARELSEQLFEPLGLEVERLSRVPYLSRGDTESPLYALDAAVWVLCSPASSPSAEPASMA